MYFTGGHFQEGKRGERSAHSGKGRVFLFVSVFLICLALLSAFVFYVPRGRQMLFGPEELRSAALEEGDVGGDVFADVPGTHPNAYALTYLKSKGIIKGYGDDNFRPDDLITRAEFVKLVVGAQHVYPHEVRYSYCFDDVAGEWFAPYVCYAKDKGWVSGSGDNLFHPDRNVQGAEMLKIMIEAYGIDLPETGGTGDLETDAPWHVPYVELADNKGWTKPLDNENNFEAEKEMTRAQVAEMLFRVIETEFPA